MDLKTNVFFIEEKEKKLFPSAV